MERYVCGALGPACCTCGDRRCGAGSVLLTRLGRQRHSVLTHEQECSSAQLGRGWSRLSGPCPSGSLFTLSLFLSDEAKALSPGPTHLSIHF